MSEENTNQVEPFKGSRIIGNGSKPTRHNRFALMRRMLPRRSARLVAGLIILGLVLLIAIFLPLFSSDPNQINDIGLSGPSAAHLLGTTKSGQDVLAQLGYSTRGSLIIGFSVGCIALVLSTVFGVLGTYIGGWVDELFALITNVMLVIPGLPLTIVIAAMIPKKGTGMLIVVISVTAWAGASRVLRAQTLSIRGRDYVLAARIAGEHPLRVICVEILPNLLPVMASQFTFSVLGAILSESSLSFIGLGSSNQFSLGTMLFYAQNGSALNAGAWWWFLPPGLMIALVGAGLSFINFSIDEVINPRLRDTRVGSSKHRKHNAKAAKASGSVRVAGLESE